MCHRDLKLENLVLDQAWNLKLIDFGLACPLTGTNQRGFCHRGEKVGTEGYMAPEVLLDCKYQPAMADIFALGVIIFSIYTGVMPFGKAMISDSYYELICLRKTDLFWRVHERRH